MADYLLPECELSNKEKIELYHIRTEMNDLPFNYGNKILCDKGCKEILDNHHFLNCPLSNNKNKEEGELNRILNDPMNEEILTLKKFQEEEKQRKKKLWDSVELY